MNKNISLLAILTVGAMMTIGAVAPALAEHLTELQAESRDKVDDAVAAYDEKDLNERAVVCEKAEKEQLILMDKGEEPIPEIDDIAAAFCVK